MRSVRAALATVIMLIATSPYSSGCDRREREGQPTEATELPAIARRIPPIIVAAFVGDRAAVEGQVAAGADPDTVFAGRMTPLVAAAATDNVKMLSLLIELGADVNLRLPQGNSALTTAVDTGNYDAVVELLGSGANPNVTNDAGLKPIHVALARGDRRLVRILAPYVSSTGELETPFAAAMIDVNGFVARAAVPLASLVVRPLGITIDPSSGTLYWTEYLRNRIRTFRPATSTVETVVDRLSYGPIDVAFQSSNDRLYWTSDAVYPRRVSFLDAGSGRRGTVASGPFVNRPRAIAAASGAVFWSEVIHGRLRSIARPGDLPDDVYSDVLSGWNEQPNSEPFEALGLAIDEVGGHVYWTEFLNSRVVRSTLDGTERRRVASESDGVDAPAGIAFDPGRGDLYWADVGREAIVRAPATGIELEVVLDATSGLVEPRDVAVDPDAGWLYWVDAARDAVGRARLDGTQVAWLDLRAPVPLGFVPVRESPGDCEQRIARVMQRTAKRISVCIEKVDLAHAMKRGFGDVRRVVGSCVRQLSNLAPGEIDSFEFALAANASSECDDGKTFLEALRKRCGEASSECTASQCVARACRDHVYDGVASVGYAAIERLDAIRPFLGEAPEAQRALAVVDDVQRWVQDSRSAEEPRSDSPLATGMKISYRALRRGGDEPSPVADDAARDSPGMERFHDNRDGTISDPATGLTWEKKCDDCGGSHDVALRLAFDSDSPGVESVTDWLAAMNRERFAGYDDWRLPTVPELQSLIDYSRFNPATTAALDGAACGIGCSDLTLPVCSCSALEAYWTSTPFADDDSHAWTVTFNLGLIGDLEKRESAAVRAVRGTFYLGNSQLTEEDG